MVHAQEPYVGHGVGFLQELQHPAADLLARDLGRVRLVLETVSELADLLLADGPLVGGYAQLAQELVGIERLQPAGAFTHHERLELRALVSGEAARARKALTAAPDGGTLV